MVSPHDRHPDAGDLALRALGESLTTEDSVHLASCPGCQSELDEITAIVTATRSVTPDDYPVAPPAHVWQAIASEALGRPAPAAPAPELKRRRSKPRGRWFRQVQWPGTLVGATAAVAVFGVGSVVATSAFQSEPAAVVAATDLAPLPTQSATGTAAVVASDGGRELTLDVADLPAPDNAYYEVWLISEDISGMVSLGTLDGSSATLPIPEGVELANYPVVDVSIEPYDGDPTHSSDSLVRGTLSV